MRAARRDLDAPHVLLGAAAAAAACRRGAGRRAGEGKRGGALCG